MKAIITNKNIHDYLDNEQFEFIESTLKTMDPADIADICEDLSREHQKLLFSLLDFELASEVLSEIEPEDADDIAELIPPAKLAKILEEMAPDDTVDLFNDLEDEEKKNAWNFLSKDKKEEIQNLTSYDEDSAGGLMTPEFCAIPANSTVQKAISIISKADFSDPIAMIFIVNNQNKLIGNIWISDLLAKEKNSIIQDAMEENPIYSRVDEDRENVAYKFKKYNLYAIPVIDDNDILIGRITVDDVVDVIFDEADENMAHISGAPDIEQHEESPLLIVKLRLPWLLITMFAGLVISLIVRTIGEMPNAETLAIFVPAIMAMGGNTGMQSSAVAIRKIALFGDKFDKLLALFKRELLVGLMMGVVCGVITGGIVYSTIILFDATTSQPPLNLALIVSVSMLFAMTFAATAGAIMPILLHRFKIDPAVASGPFVTTGNDIAASIIYFFMCSILLNI